ncbi:MAG TPA: hypothetical protein VJU61_24290, partial [Polyangiaceae bacterium]|nr:hypothetical protein [Polyangiaceae bacterium]
SLVPSLDASVTVDLRNAIEFPGGANAVGIDGEPYVYVGLWSSPTVERWDLQADGSLRRGPSISFANLGVTDTSSVAFTPIVSRNKSYFADYTGAKLVTWNPAAMEAVGTIELPLENEGALVPVLMSYLTVRDDSVLVNSFMNDLDDGTKYSDRSRLLAIDTRTDEVVSVDEWVGCEKMQLAGQTSDGTAYYTADNSRTFVRHVLGAGYGAAACGLRVVPSGKTFDQGYNVDLRQLVGGRPVVGDMMVVSDTLAFLRVWHEEDVPQAVTLENFQDVYATTPAFHWWTWEIGSSAAREIPDQVPQAGFADRFSVDGRTFVVDNSLIKDDAGGSAPFIELTPSGELRRALTGKGQVGGTIFRVR